MLKITKGSASSIYPTFTELMTNSSNWIMIKLESEMLKNRDEQYFLLKSNISLFTQRYDKYIITETSDLNILDPENAIISVPLTGFYIYTAFEVPFSTIFLGADTDIIKQVETGRLKVVGEDDDITLDDVYK